MASRGALGSGEADKRLVSARFCCLGPHSGLCYSARPFKALLSVVLPVKGVYLDYVSKAVPVPPEEHGDTNRIDYGHVHQ
jgi:hypothetical protein